MLSWANCRVQTRTIPLWPSHCAPLLAKCISLLLPSSTRTLIFQTNARMIACMTRQGCRRVDCLLRPHRHGYPFYLSVPRPRAQLFFNKISVIGPRPKNVLNLSLINKVQTAMMCTNKSPLKPMPNKLVINSTIIPGRSNNNLTADLLDEPEVQPTIVFFHDLLNKRNDPMF